jgi:glycosyltransferase involved in cell wall biosynthesis
MACVSEALLATCARLGVGRSLLLIRNGLPTIPPAAPRADGPLRIGFAGMNAAWKGFATIAAWANRRPTVPLEWHLFGDPSPDLLDGLSALRRAAGPCLFAHGRMRPEEVFEQIDVLAHPSMFFDPLPTALIEAARAGIPAVATDVGGSREIVVHGATGFLFPPSDPGVGYAQLQQLASDVALRRRMAEYARRRFDHEFGVGRMADSYLALWRQYLQKPEAEHCRRWPESPACPAPTVR